MFHGNSLTFRYFSRRMSLRSVWQNFDGRLFSGSQINLCNSVCSNGPAYWFSGDWAMETVPVLMLRGHAINMSWKTQLYFSRCWNYTMCSGPLTKYPIFIKWHLEWFPLDRIRLPYQFRSIIVCWVTSLQKICVHHISLASKIYRAPAAIDQENFILFPPHSLTVH